jgi:hypothetical protein
VGYEIVPYDPRLEAEVVELLRALWTPDVRVNAAHLRWKYFDNPSGIEPLIYVALADGVAVAMRGFYGSRWESGGAAGTEPIPHADDLIVVPAHRNKGVVKPLMTHALGDLARRGHRRVINLGAQPVTVLSSLADGWRRVGGVGLAGFDREMPGLRGRLLGRLRRTRGLWRIEESFRHSPLTHPFRRLDRAARAHRGPISVTRTPRPEAMAAMVATQHWDGRIRQVRDAAYLGWRFAHRYHDYRFLFWEEGGLRGYLVLQRSVSRLHDATRVRLVDWCAADHRVLQNLLTTALEWGRFARFATWTAGVDDVSRAILEGIGCRPLVGTGLRAQGKGLLFRSLDGTWSSLGQRDPLTLQSWDLRMLDSMEG